MGNAAVLDNPLIKEIIAVMRAGLDANGLSNVKVKQSNQPTNQGANTAPTLYLDKIPGDKRYGFLRRTDEWVDDVDPPFMRHIEAQVYESTFQFTALSIQNPADVTQLTASDLANWAASIIQSDAARLALQAKGIGMLRITEIRNPYFVDDKNRFEASPSFDFTLTHEKVIISTSPAVVTYEADVKRV